jgi:osmoprotectant transport system permease protein
MSVRASLMPVLMSMCLSANGEPVVAGSKNFTESYILAEIAAQLLEDNGIQVERRLGLNGTKIAFTALQNGAIDFYPEYSGTLSEVILAEPDLEDWNEIEAAVLDLGLGLMPPLGFNNTYAIAVTRQNGGAPRPADDLRPAARRRPSNRTVTRVPESRGRLAGPQSAL